MLRATLIVVCVCLAACRETPPPVETTVPPATLAQLALTPADLCSALKDAGLAAGKWKQGATDYSCASPELPIGPRDAKTSASSSIWYEVRGSDPSSATTIVLGGDVRMPEAEVTVRNKLVELSEALVKRLNIQAVDELRPAITENRPAAIRAGQYALKYSSQMTGPVRENRLVIQRAI